MELTDLPVIQLIGARPKGAYDEMQFLVQGMDRLVPIQELIAYLLSREVELPEMPVEITIGAAAPISAPAEGEPPLYFDEASGALYAWNGSAWANVGSGGANTNLAYLASPANGIVSSDTGQNATLPLANNTNAGLMAPGDKGKLDGIAPNAQANVQADWVENNAASDAFILNKPAIPGAMSGATAVADGGQGLAPQPLAGQQGYFLRGDGAWAAAPAGGGGVLRYDAGNGAIVKATGAGVSFSKTGGTSALTIPSGVDVLGASIQGVSADLAGDGSFSVVFSYQGDNNLNEGVATITFPTVTLWNTAAHLAGGPTPSLPFPQDSDNDPQVQVVGVGGNSLTLRIANLNAYTNWAIAIQI